MPNPKDTLSLVERLTAARKGARTEEDARTIADAQDEIERLRARVILSTHTHPLPKARQPMPSDTAGIVERLRRDAHAPNFTSVGAANLMIEAADEFERLSSELQRAREVFAAIITRAENGQLGTSKVLDMKSLATTALASLPVESGAEDIVQAGVQGSGAVTVPGCQWQTPDTLPECEDDARFAVYLVFDDGSVRLADWVGFTIYGSEYHGSTGVYLGSFPQDGDAYYMTDDGFEVRKADDGRWFAERFHEDGSKAPFYVTHWMEALKPLPPRPGDRTDVSEAQDGGLKQTSIPEGFVLVPVDLIKEIWSAIKDNRDQQSFAEARTRELSDLLRRMKSAGLADWIPTLEEVQAAGPYVRVGFDETLEEASRRAMINAAPKPDTE